MAVVSVVALKDFDQDGQPIHCGQLVHLSAIDAAWRARRGDVTLDRLARPTYQTRDMVAAEPVMAVALVEAPPAVIEPAPDVSLDPTDPPKRRRGRPRKQQPS